jgi:DNA-binding MarR family transcriptional regulator
MTNCNSPETPIANALCSAELVVHLARLAQSGATAGQLTPAQWTALRYFARANRFSRTPSAFSEFHGTTRGTASQTVKSLVTLGLMVRHCNMNDARSALFEVTPAGMAQLTKDPLEDLRDVFRTLPKDIANTLLKALQTAATKLANRRDAPTFGNCGDCGHCDQSSDKAYCHCTHSELVAQDMPALCVDFRPIPHKQDRFS